MDPERQVSENVCREKHQRIEQQVANLKEWQEKMEKIITGNGQPEKGLIHQAYENTEFRKETEAFIREMNRKMWGAILTGAITGIGMIGTLAYYLPKLAR